MGCLSYKWQEYIWFDYIYKNQSENFRLTKKFSDFDMLKKWETIWTDGTKKLYTKKDRIIVFSQDCDRKNEEAFVLWTRIW